MTESENLKQKLNVCLSLEVYLFLLELAPSSKLEHRKAILNFLCLLFARDRQAPIEKDYDDYRYYLQILRKQDISRVERALSYAQRFFSWLAENPKCTSLETLNIPLKQRPRRKRERRVSTSLSSYLYEQLELLANHDGIDIPTMLNVIVSKYVAHRKDDINREKNIQES